MPSRRNNRHKKTQRVNKHRKFTGGIGSINISNPQKKDFDLKSWIQSASVGNTIFFYRGARGLNISSKIGNAISTVPNALNIGTKNVGNWMFGKKAPPTGAIPAQPIKTESDLPKTLALCYSMKLTKVQGGLNIIIDFGEADAAFINVALMATVIDGLNAMTGFGNRTAIKNALLSGKVLSNLDRKTTIELEITTDKIIHFQINTGGGMLGSSSNAPIITRGAPAVSVCGIVNFVDRTLFNASKNNVLVERLSSDDNFQRINYKENKDCSTLFF